MQLAPYRNLIFNDTLNAWWACSVGYEPPVTYRNAIFNDTFARKTGFGSDQ